LARCAAIKPDGGRCKTEAMPDAEWCYSHHPDYAEERRRRASRAGKAGGRGRPATELRDVKALCEDLTNRVLEGALLPGPAAVANQLINTRLRAIEQERKNKETEDLEARIEALETKLGQPTKGVGQWQRRP
jgi:hypothetical protein